MSPIRCTWAAPYFSIAARCDREPRNGATVAEILQSTRPLAYDCGEDIGRPVFLFPGQGSQYPGMAAGFIRANRLCGE